jgi:capsular polysaccharide biosynthesis protein
VFGPGVVISPDGRSIARDVSVDYGQPFDNHWLLRHKNLPRPRFISGRSAVVATSGGSNYYHWLLDELPRLLTINTADIDTVIGHNLRLCARAALKLSGFTGKVLEPAADSYYRCDHLVVPTLVGKTGHPTPKAVNLVTRLTEPLFTKTSSFGEYVYISRENATRRRVSNEEELWLNLQSKGFNKWMLEELSWEEQINLFRNARVIVAPHGAGLANLVFCRAGTKVIEFFNRSYLHWCFWQLASINNLDYRPIVPLSSEPITHAMDKCGTDCEADCNQIMKALSD